MNDPALRHTGLYCNQLSSADLLKTEADGNQVSKKESPSAELAEALWIHGGHHIACGCGPWLYPCQLRHWGDLTGSPEPLSDYGTTGMLAYRVLRGLNEISFQGFNQLLGQIVESHVTKQCYKVYTSKL